MARSIAAHIGYQITERAARVAQGAPDIQLISGQEAGMTAWYYADEQRQTVGPVPQDRLIAILSGMERPDEVFVWRAGFDDWKRASEVEEMHSPVSAKPPLPPVPIAQVQLILPNGESATLSTKKAAWVKDTVRVFAGRRNRNRIGHADPDAVLRGGMGVGAPAALCQPRRAVGYRGLYGRPRAVVGISKDASHQRFWLLFLILHLRYLPLDDRATDRLFLLGAEIDYHRHVPLRRRRGAGRTPCIAVQ